ncbi:MAG TPA: zinc ribbon domain-containing protein [Gemmatimonadaceae bacterium]|nr:zinc ribbon domain-containing protein [Gemmatimonadaceae bacterium]
MPTYEYRCPEGHDFERFYRKISDAVPEVPCPECGKVAERRLSAGAGLLFKGSGFYLTDYGKNAHRSSGSAPKATEGGSSREGAASSTPSSGDAGSGSSSSATPAASSDSKPAAPAKAESKPASTGSTPKSDK